MHRLPAATVRVGISATTTTRAKSSGLILPSSSLPSLSVHLIPTTPTTIPRIGARSRTRSYHSPRGYSTSSSSKTEPGSRSDVWPESLFLTLPFASASNASSSSSSKERVPTGFKSEPKPRMLRNDETGLFTWTKEQEDEVIEQCMDLILERRGEVRLIRKRARQRVALNHWKEVISKTEVNKNAFTVELTFRQRRRRRDIRWKARARIRELESSMEMDSEVLAVTEQDLNSTRTDSTSPFDAPLLLSSSSRDSPTSSASPSTSPISPILDHRIQPFFNHVDSTHNSPRDTAMKMVEEYKSIESELQSYENFVMAKEWVIKSGLLAQETYGTSDDLGKENQNQSWESWDASHISNLRSEQKIYNFFKAKMVDFFRKKNIVTAIPSRKEAEKTKTAMDVLRIVKDMLPGVGSTGTGN